MSSSAWHSLCHVWAKWVRVLKALTFLSSPLPGVFSSGGDRRAGQPPRGQQMCSGPSQQEREGLPKQGLPYAGIPVPDLIPVPRPVGPMDQVLGVGAEGRGCSPWN